MAQPRERVEAGNQVLGLVILRIKEPNLERPYKTWIITPLTFCAVWIRRCLGGTRIVFSGLFDAGSPVLIVHAHHRGPPASNSRPWYANSLWG
jgi:hypothetical protein